MAILIVDDDAALCETLVDQLGSMESLPPSQSAPSAKLKESWARGALGSVP